MKKALFLDDEPYIINSFKRILRPFNSRMDFQFFTSPSEAENYIKKQMPEFCFTDYKMPGIDGVSFIKKMKKISPSTQFYILSGESMNTRFNDPEITGSLSKPCSLQVLKEVLKEEI